MRYQIGLEGMTGEVGQLLHAVEHGLNLNFGRRSLSAELVTPESKSIKNPPAGGDIAIGVPRCPAGTHPAHEPDGTWSCKGTPDVERGEPAVSVAVYIAVMAIVAAVFFIAGYMTAKRLATQRTSPLDSTLKQMQTR